MNWEKKITNRFVLFCFEGGQLEKLMDDLHAELSTNPPLPGSYTARKGDLCAALFVDNNWYVCLLWF